MIRKTVRCGIHGAAWMNIADYQVSIVGAEEMLGKDKAIRKAIDWAQSVIDKLGFVFTHTLVNTDTWEYQRGPELIMYLDDWNDENFKNGSLQSDFRGVIASRDKLYAKSLRRNGRQPLYLLSAQQGYSVPVREPKGKRQARIVSLNIAIYAQRDYRMHWVANPIMRLIASYVAGMYSAMVAEYFPAGTCYWDVLRYEQEFQVDSVEVPND